MQIQVPCCTGWGFESDKTMAIAKLAIVRSVGELRDGRREGDQGKKVVRKPVEEYLKTQKRFRHLFKPKRQDAEIAAIQVIADKNAEKYGIDIKIRRKSKVSFLFSFIR